MLKNHNIRSSQDLGQLIAMVRKQRGLSQRALAADFGVTQAWLSRVEQGNQKGWIGQILRLVSYLDIELNAQLGSDDSDNNSAVKKPSGDYPDLDKLV